MKCSRELIEGYMDEELDPSLHATVSEHLVDCQRCSETYAQIVEQQSAIRSLAPYYAVPAGLRESVRQALRKSVAQNEEAQPSNVPWRWMAIAASALLAVSVTWNIDHLPSRTPESTLIAQNIMASHVRSLIGTHLMDVVSTDQHTVKPWFNGKLDFSPEVKDFAAQGFPLVGGRIEYIADRPVAALVYHRRQHVVNLFTWPSTPSDTAESHFSRNGYNVVQWSNASMTYWAVSDIPAAEIQQFRALRVK
jgi:anti-sigma factor RsiW